MSRMSMKTGQVAKFPLAKFKKFLSYLKINSRDYGRVPFRLLGSQRYALDEVVKGINDGITTFVILKGRGGGITTLFIAVDFFYAMRTRGLLGTFILHEEKALEKWRAIIELFVDSMPNFIIDGGRKIKFRPKIIKHNRNLLMLSNESSFSYLTAGVDENRSGGLGRSQHTNFVHSTETAFYGNDEQLKEFKSSVSHLYEYRLQIYESTANGFNHYYDQCEDAKTSQTMRFIFIGWWRDERNQFHVRDKRFQQFVPNNKISVLERQRIRAVKERFGFEISLQQIAWYRWKLVDEFNNDQTTMDQEFPWTEDDAFQATGAKYFQSPTLTQLYREAHKIPFEGYRYHMTRRWEDTSVTQVSRSGDAQLKVWAHASRFGYYVVACDPAYGSSDDADNFLIQVWRCYAEGITQVAEFASHDLSYYQCAWIIAHLAGFYGRKDVRVIIEINGAGKAVFRELMELKHELAMMPSRGSDAELRKCLDNMKHYFYSRVDTMSGELAYQWITSDDRKREIMARFKDAIELQKMHVRSVPMIAEMQRLVNDAGSIAADGAGNDDRPVTAALAWECYSKWLRPILVGEGMTRAAAEKIDARGGIEPIDRLVVNYLKRSNIKVA
jgi:quinol monooxygenase YgiN